MPDRIGRRCQSYAVAEPNNCHVPDASARAIDTAKTFDAAADGIDRGEGCGMVVLKRLTDAVAGRNILAVIHGNAVNHDGPSSGLTVPNKHAQETVIRNRLKQGKVAPHEVAYVEAHGTGTALGDPIEVHTLAAVFATPQRQQPLFIGSVKTNIGHLEAAAGIASLIKVVLALQHNELPPTYISKRQPRTSIGQRAPCKCPRCGRRGPQVNGWPASVPLGWAARMRM